MRYKVVFEQMNFSEYTLKQFIKLKLYNSEDEFITWYGIYKTDVPLLLKIFKSKKDAILNLKHKDPDIKWFSKKALENDEFIVCTS